MAPGMQVPRPVFSAGQVQLELGLGRKGVSSGAVAPSTSAPLPQPDISYSDFPGHSAVWDARTELWATESPSHPALRGYPPQSCRPKICPTQRCGPYQSRRAPQLLPSHRSKPERSTPSLQPSQRKRP
ncbi:hypothetical protein FIBSPDRAFT_277816 [Athelia psychrophila]|uniref:Uncharacterized protein n=1 Tax=Athelia psychrophila TaxID=1759441 RepID=A0A165WQ42_9AGAM|nr:hypothetical protein FIBSPDRAFT_277816 [Fibularhizoctonia sp. CBS 109695]